jgi:hypothetical protein
VGFRRANAAAAVALLGRGRLLAELKSRYGGDDVDGHELKCAWSGSASGNRVILSGRIGRERM